MKDLKRYAVNPHITMQRARKARYQESAERDYLLAAVGTFMVGAMLGAIIAIGVLS